MNHLTVVLTSLSFVAFVASPPPAPTDVSSGIAQITWSGFDAKTTTLKPPANLVLNLPPISVVNKVFTYTDAIQVEVPFIPKKSGIGSPGLTGPWFVQRRVFSNPFDKGAQKVLVSTSKLAINGQGLAVSSTGGFGVPMPTNGDMLTLDYRLGHTVTIVGKGSDPKKLPTAKKVDQFLDGHVEVALVPTICQTGFNQFRPLPCEFETVKLEILGKTGQVLFTVVPNDKKKIQFPNGQAKKVAGPSFIYDARWTVRRINTPNYPPGKGYLVNYGASGSDFAKEADEHGPLATGLNLSGAVGKEFTISFEVQVSPLGGAVTTRQVLLENDVTKTKFKSGDPAAVRAETNLPLNW